MSEEIIKRALKHAEKMARKTRVVICVYEKCISIPEDAFGMHVTDSAVFFYKRREDGVIMTFEYNINAVKNVIIYKESDK